MSQIEARARENAGDPRGDKLRVILTQIGRWALPTLGIIALGLAGLSYGGDRGEGDVQVAQEGLDQAQSDLEAKKTQLDEQWGLSVEAATGVSLSQLSLASLTEDEVVQFAQEQFAEPLPIGYELVDYNPILRSIDTNGVMYYVVMLDWQPALTDDNDADSPQSGIIRDDSPQSEDEVILYPLETEDGLLFNPDDEVMVSSRNAIVWFSIIDATDGSGRKQIADLTGGDATVPERSK